MIIDRLVDEGVVHVICGSRKDRRANVYAIPVTSVYRLKERMAQVNKPENDKPERKTNGNSAVDDRNRAIMSRMTYDKFFRLCVLRKNEHFYEEIDKDLYIETYMRLKDYYFGEDETILIEQLNSHGIKI